MLIVPAESFARWMRVRMDMNVNRARLGLLARDTHSVKVFFTSSFLFRCFLSFTHADSFAHVVSDRCEWVSYSWYLRFICMQQHPRQLHLCEMPARLSGRRQSELCRLVFLILYFPVLSREFCPLLLIFCCRCWRMFNHACCMWRQ